jgi:hypothetical protein
MDDQMGRIMESGTAYREKKLSTKTGWSWSRPTTAGIAKTGKGHGGQI